MEIWNIFIFQKKYIRKTRQYTYTHFYYDFSTRQRFHFDFRRKEILLFKLIKGFTVLIRGMNT